MRLVRSFRGTLSERYEDIANQLSWILYEKKFDDIIGHRQDLCLKMVMGRGIEIIVYLPTENDNKLRHKIIAMINHAAKHGIIISYEYVD
jgi:hypothetical protein